MSIGHKIIDEIGLQGMVTIGYPDPEATHVFVWSSSSAEQLEALVADHDRQQRLEFMSALKSITEKPLTVGMREARQLLARYEANGDPRFDGIDRDEEGQPL